MPHSTAPLTIEAKESFGIVTKKENIEELYKTINQVFKDNDEVVGGASILPNDTGLSVKILGNSSEDNKTTVYNISQIIRRQFF